MCRVDGGVAASLETNRSCVVHPVAVPLGHERGVWEGVLKGGGWGGVVAVEKGSCVGGCGDVAVLAAFNLWSAEAQMQGGVRVATVDNLVVSRVKVEGVATTVMRWFRKVSDGGEGVGVGLPYDDGAGKSDTRCPLGVLGAIELASVFGLVV